MTCFKGVEFPLEFRELFMDAPGLAYTELLVSGELMKLTEDQARPDIVFSEEDDTGKLSYWARPVDPGPFSLSFRVPKRGCGIRAKLYIWDHGAAGLHFRDLRITMEHVIQEP